jgi:ABC-2 type transport system permease protein
VSEARSGGVSGRRLVTLVAEREIRERVKAKSFRISTLIAMVVTAGAIILPTLSSNPLQSTVKVGLVDRDQRDVEATLAQLKFTGAEAKASYHTYSSRDAAARALRADDIHIAVIAERELLLKEPIDPDDVSPKVRVARLLSVLPAITRAPVPISSVVERPERERGDATSAFFGTILLYAFLAFYGNAILSGVAQEKGSRVIEILLSTVPARRMLAGKVLGIGVVALIQSGLIAVSALVAYQAAGKNPLAGSTGGQVLQIFGWFLLAYLFYASAYAAVGATISRQEEAGNVSFPLMLPIIIAYIAAGSALGGEDSRLLRILSFLPPTAPIAMPMRSALGFASPAQVALSVVSTLIGTAIVIRLAGTIYERSILRMGARVRLKDALRTNAT